jgi:hypothetical protein
MDHSFRNELLQVLLEYSCGHSLRGGSLTPPGDHAGGGGWALERELATRGPFLGVGNRSHVAIGGRSCRGSLGVSFEPGGFGTPRLLLASRPWVSLGQQTIA